MRVLVYGLMALALSVSAVLMSVHHSGADAHAATASASPHVHLDAVPHDTVGHTESVTIPDAHPQAIAQGCVACGDGGESMFLMVCALLAVLISLAALMHPAQTRLTARPAMVLSSRPPPPDEPCAPRGVNLDELCVSRR